VDPPKRIRWFFKKSTKSLDALVHGSLVSKSNFDEELRDPWTRFLTDAFGATLPVTKWIAKT
jgi:hypothetical protein